MVDYHYDDNIHKQLRRRRRIRVAVYSSIITVFIGVGLLLFDMLRNSSEVSHQNSSETRILGQLDESRVFDEKLFSFTTDSTWNREPQIPDMFKAYSPYRYRSTSQGFSLQELYIFVDSIPEDLEITFVLPVESDGRGVKPFEISRKCNELLEDPGSKISQVAEWGGVRFICDPDRGAYLVGTSHNKDGYGTRVAGTNSVHRYFFLFNDVQSVPELNTFVTILRTFQTK